MSNERQRLLDGIAAIEAQRPVLGDAVVDASVSGLRSALAALDNDDTAESEQDGRHLRQVSILFLDVVGSTQLSQRLEPEEILAVMDGALRRCSRVVEAQSGRVMQYAGDNLLAVFGAQETREDDAERAVRAGLALLETGRLLASEIEASYAYPGFALRVGIHTGSVLLGGGVDADRTIRGLAVNVAARMEQTAPPDSLRISQDTYALVRGMFDVTQQALLEVKGVNTPLQSYLVQRAKPRSFRIVTRGFEGVTTRMIGRTAELELLKSAFERLFVERRLSAITVVGDAGIGKSRLLNEFEAWTEARPERFYIFRGRATPQTQGQPFGLLRDILAWRFQLADDDAADTARQKLEQGIAPLFAADEGDEVAESHVHLLGHLIGLDYRDSRHIKGILDDPRQIRGRALHATAQIFRRVGAGSGWPVVLQIEDLHWADNETLDFLEDLAEINRDVAMLILAFTRPTLFERRAHGLINPMRAPERQLRIELAPLDKQQSRALAGEILQRLPELPVALRELVIGQAEGNPFFMEELVRMLIDQGAIVAGQEWALDANRLLATRIPGTLTGVLQARLDSLPAPEKLSLQRASVIGAAFWDKTLIAIDEGAIETLPALVRRDLILPRHDKNLEGLREYAFRHQLLHQVTYQTVLGRHKRKLHGQIAAWLAAQTGRWIADLPAVTAEHFELAGEHLRAAEYWARAAEHAAGRFAHDAVVGHAKRALEALGRLPGDLETSRQRWRVLDVRERTLDFQGKRAAQRDDIDALEMLADALNEDRLRASVAWRRSTLALRTGEYAALERAAREAAALAERANVQDLRLLSLRMLALALIRQDQIERGKSLAQQTLIESRQLNLPAVQAMCLNTIAAAAFAVDDLVGALALDRQHLELCRATANRRMEALALGNVGATQLELGEFTAADAHLREGLRLTRTIGDRALECAPLCNLSQLALILGDAIGAASLASEALDTAVGAEARDWEAIALVMLGNAQMALDQVDAALASFERAQSLGEAVGHEIRHWARSGLARTALVRKDVAAAMQHIEPLLAEPTSHATFDLTREIELTCYRVLSRAKDTRANGWLDRAHANLLAKAGRISDEAVRQRFLTSTAEHREILALWAARS